MDTTIIPTVAPPTVDRAAGSVDHHGTVALRARGLRRSVRGHVLLDDVDLDIPAGSLVAIAGPSGAGKSTLLAALAGLTPPSGGSVETGDPDLAIGFVPQEDIIHRDLPLGTTLTYAARLRLDATDPATIDRSVTDTLDLLGLADQREVRVGALSGGQRKRASIAVELLTDPGTCLFDEPTSGLDPISATGVVACLRALADRGTTVVMTTHDPTQLALADRVVLLAAGGRLVVDGSPDEVRRALRVDDLIDVYEHLVDDDVVTALVAVRAAGRAGDEAVRGTAPAGSPPPTPAPARVPVPVPVPVPGAGLAPARDAVRRWAVLTRRTAALLVANRLTMAVLVGSPVLVIAMMALLFPAGAFDDPAAAATTAPQILFWMAFAAFFFGLTYGLLQIVTERDIVRRERAGGIATSTYLAAKLGVLVPVLAIVCLALLTMLLATDRVPALDPATFGVLLATLVLEATAALALGMLASAAVSDAAQATLALPMLCFPQVLFAGAIVPLASMSPVAQVLSTPLATRWAFEALGRSLPATPETASGALVYPEVFLGSPAGAWVVLVASTVICLAATRHLLER
jgi:ABC-type multidrug transport system ATPase subunit